MALNAVFFDIGGTLERSWYTPEQRFQSISGLKQLLLSEGIELEICDADIFEKISKGYLKYRHFAIDTMVELATDRVWNEFILAGLKLDKEKISTVSEKLMYYLEENFYQREFRTEVPQVLGAIKNLGLRIGLISNICSRGLVPDNLRKYRIKDFFEPVILSSVFGRRKPDPVIFQHAANLVNLPVEDCAYVGDRIARDIVGARQAGFGLAVQIINDFDHGEDDTGAEPDAIIYQMTELLEILKQKI